MSYYFFDFEVEILEKYIFSLEINFQGNELSAGDEYANLEVFQQLFGSHENFVMSYLEKILSIY